MISPEVLRRYPFFNGLSAAQLQAIAMITDEHPIHKGKLLFDEGQPADKLYLLIDGSVDFYMKSEEENEPSTRKEFSVGEVNPGDVFGISTLVEPYIFQVSARVAQDGKILLTDGVQLRTLMQTDKDLTILLMTSIVKLLVERLNLTRVQLAAAWA
jgi:CRP-like cAMP-binding protein